MKKTETKATATASREENKNKFFQSLFCLSKPENSAIANEVIRLCSMILPQYILHFSEIGSLIEEARRHRRKESTELSVVYENIKANHLLLIDYITAFISVPVKHAHYCQKQYDQYKALTLLVMVQLSCQGNHEHDALCNELRQCALGKRKDLTSYLPNVLITDFSSLIDDLKKLQHVEVLSTSSIPSQLSKIKTSYRNFYYHKERIKRDVSPREFKKEGRLQSSKKQYLDDDKDTSVTEIKELKFGENHNGDSPWVEEEELSTTSRTLTVISSPVHIKKDYAVQAIQARAINECIRKKSMKLTCDIYRVTPYELHTLVSACITSLRHDDQHKESTRALLLMLLTGNSFEETTHWKAFRKNTGSIIGIKRNFRLPSHNLNKRVQPLLKKVTEDYPLLLPLNLVSSLKNFEFRGVKENDLKQFLSSLNKNCGVKLSLSKVSSYLPQILKTNGIDCTIIDLITGYDVRNQPARFYTHIPYKILHSIFDRYLTHIGNAGDTNYLDDRENIDATLTEKNLGSPLFVDDSTLQSLFSQMYFELQNIPTNHTAYFSEKSHNRRLLYLQLMLSIVSGYRPVNGWFGSLDDIHFASGEYRIAEKERALGYTGRTVLLPKIVLIHIQQYINYCEQAVIYFSHSDADLTLRYKQSIQGDMPFSFYRHQETIQETKPSTYMQHIKQIFPFPENWARHYLRSFLFSQDISDELIGAWMGHIHSNQLPFAQFSQLSRKELQSIRNLLEVHITNLLSGELK